VLLGHALCLISAQLISDVLCFVMVAHCAYPCNNDLQRVVIVGGVWLDLPWEGGCRALSVNLRFDLGLPAALAVVCMASRLARWGSAPSSSRQQVWWWAGVLIHGSKLCVWPRLDFNHLMMTITHLRSQVPHAITSPPVTLSRQNSVHICPNLAGCLRSLSHCQAWRRQCGVGVVNEWFRP
jgi:hypothetical protein